MKGLPCPLSYERGGGLLPHHFTLTSDIAWLLKQLLPLLGGGIFSVALSMQASLSKNLLRTLSGSFIPRCPDFPHYPFEVRAIIRQNSFQS